MPWQEGGLKKHRGGTCHHQADGRIHTNNYHIHTQWTIINALIEMMIL